MKHFQICHLINNGSITGYSVAADDQKDQTEYSACTEAPTEHFTITGPQKSWIHASELRKMDWQRLKGYPLEVKWIYIAFLLLIAFITGPNYFYKNQTVLKCRS